MKKLAIRWVCMTLIAVCMMIGLKTAVNCLFYGISEDVLAYEEDIKSYAKLYDMEAYVTLIEAVMMQESKGKGTDVMQCSECMYNTLYDQTPNAITDPLYSIEVGIRYLKHCLELAGASGADDIEAIKLALQGYNFGSGYITWVQETDGIYTEENAETFSEMMKSSKDTAVYGDTKYVQHVLRYYVG